MAGQLDGRVALVTGASSGIGEATAAALVEQGARVAVAARRTDRLQVLAGRLGEGSVLVQETDVTDEEAVRAAVDAAVEHFGSLDILVNNAGVMLLGSIVGADTEDWRRMVNLNVLGLMYATHAALPALLSAAEERGVADIVNVSSVAGRVARLGSGGYNATKWGVNAFSESLRQEVTERHVRVSLVEPGAVATELTTHITDAAAKQAIQSTVGKMTPLEADDIARAVVYVVSQPAHVAVNEVLIRPTEQSH